MIATDKFEKVEAASVAELRAWLEAHHTREESVWLVTWKAGVPEKYLSTGAVLDELLCFGWIDGIRRKLDRDRTMQLIAPRKTQHWAKSYKERAARLIEEGRMAKPGLAAIERSKANGLWTFMDDVDALIVPPDLRNALHRSKQASDYFAGVPDAYKRNLLRWVKLAKTDATRHKRIDSIVAASASGERIPQM